MQSFSQRKGLKPIRVEIQKESLDDELRNALWTPIYLWYFSDSHYDLGDLNRTKQTLFYRIWLHHYHERYDEMQSPTYIYNLVKEEFFNAQWNEALDLLEFIPHNYDQDESTAEFDGQINEEFCSECNKSFERFLSAYRFLNMQITEITSDEEIGAIEEAINSSNEIDAVKTHLKRAVQLFSDRIHPDYRNSIKESISAVESYCRIITCDEKATLGKALAILESRFALHGSLKVAFNALYGYTSDAGGIRHALHNESELKQEDAKFMLVTCSSFINYLVVKMSNQQSEQ